MARGNHHLARVVLSANANATVDLDAEHEEPTNGSKREQQHNDATDSGASDAESQTEKPSSRFTTSTAIRRTIDSKTSKRSVRFTTARREGAGGQS
jgi:hypothetical protein